jgi:hypothetical protein
LALLGPTTLLNTLLERDSYREVKQWSDVKWLRKGMCSVTCGCPHTPLDYMTEGLLYQRSVTLMSKQRSSGQVGDVA